MVNYVTTTSLGFNLLLYKTRDLNYILFLKLCKTLSFHPSAVKICILIINRLVIAFSVYSSLKALVKLVRLETPLTYSVHIKGG